MKKLKLIMTVLAVSFLLGSCAPQKGCGCLSLEAGIEFVVHLLQNS